MQAILLKEVKVGPVEGNFRALELGTSVFKRKSEYPVGRLMLQKMPEWMRIAVKFVLEQKQKGEKFLFGEMEGTAALMLSRDLERLNEVFGTHLHVESHSIKRGTVSALAALKYE